MYIESQIQVHISNSIPWNQYSHCY